MDWEVNHWFAASFEPSFTMKSADLSGIPSAPPMSELRLKYFELPLLAKFKLTKGPESRKGPFAALGPVLSVNTGAELRVTGQDENISQDVRGVDWGFSFGAGFGFDIGTGVTILDIRYVLGFQNIFKDDSTNDVKTEDLKNRSLQLTVGWVLPLNERAPSLQSETSTRQRQHSCAPRNARPHPDPGGASPHSPSGLDPPIFESGEPTPWARCPTGGSPHDRGPGPVAAR